MPLLHLSDDDLSLVVALVSIDDLLTVALACKLLYAAVLRIPAGANSRWVTRATSSVARIQWAVDVMGASPSIAWVSAVARRGDIPLICFLNERYDVPFHRKMCAAAARGGHLDCLRFIVSVLVLEPGGLNLTKRVFTAAAASGNIRVLNYLHDHEVSCTYPAFRAAVMHGHKHVLEWLDVRYKKVGRLVFAPTSSLCFHAAYAGRLDILRWLRAQEPPYDWGHESLHQALAASDECTEQQAIDILAWLRSSGFFHTAGALLPLPGEFTFALFASVGKCKVVEWLRKTLPP